MYVCAYTYLHVYVYKYTYIHEYVYVYIYMHTYTCTICIPIYIHIYACSYMHTLIKNKSYNSAMAHTTHFITSLRITMKCKSKNI